MFSLSLNRPLFLEQVCLSLVIFDLFWQIFLLAIYSLSAFSPLVYNELNKSKLVTSAGSVPLKLPWWHFSWLELCYLCKFPNSIYHQFHSLQIELKDHTHWMCCIFFTSEFKMYYSSNSMPFITSQPSSREDVPASVLEANAIAVTLANEWENEWNQSGLASRLSKEVGVLINLLCEWRPQRNSYWWILVTRSCVGDELRLLPWFCLF